jgi:hypothetical protein
MKTLFSMTMFDWNPSDGSHIVSPYIWIYWAISVPLTVIGILVWRVWWRMEDAKHSSQMAKAKYDYGLERPPSKVTEKVQGEATPVSGAAPASLQPPDLSRTTSGTLQTKFDDLFRRRRGIMVNHDNPA